MKAAASFGARSVDKHLPGSFVAEIFRKLDAGRRRYRQLRQLGFGSVLVIGVRSKTYNQLNMSPVPSPEKVSTRRQLGLV